MVIIRSASMWMLASTVLADCRAMGCKLSSKMLFARDCIAAAMMTQHTTTSIRMLRVVLLRILRFRLFLLSRPWESVFFPDTFHPLLLLKFLNSVPQPGAARREASRRG